MSSQHFYMILFAQNRGKIITKREKEDAI